MYIQEKIDGLMAEQGIKNKMQLSQKAGIPYTTIANLLNRNSKNVSQPTLVKLSQLFNCSIDYLVNDDCKDRNYSETENSLVSEEDPLLGLHHLVIRFSSETDKKLLDEAERKLISLLTIVRGRKAFLDETIEPVRVNLQEEEKKKDI
jgi:Helix-turn-helix.